MEELYRKFGNKIEFIGINLGIEKDIPKFVQKSHMTFPVSFDRGNKLAALFDAKIETNILIDKQGVIVYKEKGFRDDMDRYLRGLLEE